MTAVPVAVAACLLTCSTPSFADKSAIATNLFDQGIALMDQRKFNRACPFLEASYRQEPLLGALLALADCEYERGRLNAALTRYQEYVNRHDNLADAARNKQGNRLLEAKGRINELKRIVPSVKVTVPAKIKVPIVHLDGIRIRPDEVYPVDPGTHEVTLQVHDHDTAVVEIEARKGQAQEVPMKMGKWIPPKYIPRASGAQPADDPVDESQERLVQNFGVALGSVVLAGVIIATIFGARTLEQEGNRPKNAFRQSGSSDSASFFEPETSQSSSQASLKFINPTIGGITGVPMSPMNTQSIQPSVLPMVQFGQSPEQPTIFGIQGFF